MKLGPGQSVSLSGQLYMFGVAAKRIRTSGSSCGVSVQQSVGLGPRMTLVSLRMTLNHCFVLGDG